MKSFFFLGKGGTGKSTCSCLLACSLARRGSKTLLVSLDPAHNVGDIFRKKLGRRPKKILTSLWAAEADTDWWLEKYLDRVSREIRSAYRYLTAFNLEHHFEIFKKAPGITEQAMLRALGDYRQGSFENLVVDMPPTALSMGFFSAPEITLLWLDQLIRLRSEILAKKDVITRIKIGGSEIETDSISGRLDTLLSAATAQRDYFRKEISVALCINPDRLSRKEAGRIIRELADLGIESRWTILNKSDPNTPSIGHFEGVPVHTIPLINPPPFGTEDLMNASSVMDSLMEAGDTLT